MIGDDDNQYVLDQQRKRFAVLKLDEAMRGHLNRGLADLQAVAEYLEAQS